jgi:hypothetical protein
LRANRCRIHAQKAAQGFAGCAAYDCHGAGQRATALLAREEQQRSLEGHAPLAEREKYDAFAVLRELHELAWMLRGAAEVFGVDAALLLERIDRLAQGDLVDVLAVDSDALRIEVRALLPTRR